jgi:UDP-2-acetamido-3-amino-2,3-dideoxy-glucuronate N-acetyltransferase
MDLDVFIHPTAIVDEGAEIGAGSKIWHWTHICSGAKIGTHCSFGQNVYVASDVVIGDYVRVQNGVSLYSGLVVEDYCFIGPHAVFTNDLNPRACGPWIREKTVLRRGTSIGANATIVCGLEMGEFSMAACGSVVTKTVAPRTLVMGNPAKMYRVFDLAELRQKFSFL